MNKLADRLRKGEGTAEIIDELEGRVAKVEKQALGNKSLVVLILTCVTSIASIIIQFLGG